MTTAKSETSSFVDRNLFRDVMGRFASGVTVITTHVQGVDSGTTASAVSSLSLDPPMVLVCLNMTSSHAGRRPRGRLLRGQYRRRQPEPPRLPVRHEVRRREVRGRRDRPGRARCPPPRRGARAHPRGRDGRRRHAHDVPRRGRPRRGVRGRAVDLVPRQIRPLRDRARGGGVSRAAPARPRPRAAERGRPRCPSLGGRASAARRTSTAPASRRTLGGRHRRGHGEHRGLRDVAPPHRAPDRRRQGRDHDRPHLRRTVRAQPRHGLGHARDGDVRRPSAPAR